ncbi:MAG: diacylglycerol kinase family protein [SAR324 cluster bacterium]|nr:diacylglycerol kinase family protein [SAR324 cluster bacterium]
MAESTQIILDPSAHHQRTGRVWQAHQREWLRQFAPVEVTIAESVEEAGEAARVSAMKGFRKIIAAGGIDTAYGVVNGMMALAEPHRKSIGVGFLSMIRPGEWSRTIEFPRRLTRQVEVLRAGHTMPFDVGCVTCFAEDGRPVTRYFLNGAGFGLGPQFRAILRGGAGRNPEGLAAALLALGGVLRSLGPRVRLENASGLLYDGPCPMGLVMGGQYYPMLGKVAPQASPTDGALDALWFAPASHLDLLTGFAALLLRRKDQGPPVGSARASTLRVSAPTGAVYLEADGQYVGRLPATFTVEPKALSVIVPQVGAKLKKPVFAPLPDSKDGRLAGNLKQAVGC